MSDTETTQPDLLEAGEALKTATEELQPKTEAPAETPHTTPETPEVKVDTGSWKDSIGDDKRNYHGFANIQSVDELAQRVIDIEGLIGRKGIIPPDEKATDKEWDKFYTDLGRPETADGYTFENLSVPEEAKEWYSEDLQKAMLPSFHKHGLTPKQAEGILNDYIQMQHKAFSDAAAGQTDALNQATTSLQREWGVNFESNKKIANDALKMGLGDDAESWETLKALTLSDGSFAFDHPLIAKLMFNIGSKTVEDDTIFHGESGFASNAQQAKIEYDKIMSEAAKDSRHAYWRKDAEGKALHEKLMRLQSVITPGNVANA